LRSGFFGIDVGVDGVSVTSNKIMNSPQGIVLEQGVEAAAVQGNSITNSAIGIQFNCNFDLNVHSNIISDAGMGLQQFPGFTIPSNKYFNVGIIVPLRGGGC